MDQIKKYLNDTKQYIELHRNETILVAAAIATLAVLGALIVYGRVTTYVYEPTKACTLFSPDKAIKFFGGNVKNVTTNNGEVSVSSNLATSKCGYVNETSDVNALAPAAIAVRSSINDKGTALNRELFDKSSKSVEVEAVKDVGDAAFYETATGKLHIFKDRDWIILSYGTGSDPSLEKTTELARTIGL